MLYRYKYLENHKIEKLQTHIEHFFETIYETTKTKFTLTLLHKDFQSMAKSCSSLLLEPLERIFTQFKKLDRPEQKKIYQSFKINNSIEQLCKGEEEPTRHKDLPESLRDEIKKFFTGLYEDLPSRVSFSKQCGDLKQHFKQFCQLNEDALTCPFCGLNDLQNEFDKVRDDYDHYLPKSIYPFNSVNFRNLVPMCKRCNESYKKQEDTLYKEERRRKVFYPYDQNGNEHSITVNAVGNVTDFSNSGFEIELNGPSGFEEELDSWNDIFDIKNRYIGKIKRKFKIWDGAFRRKYKREKEKRKADFNFEEFKQSHLADLEDYGYNDQTFLQKSVFANLYSNPDFEDNLETTIAC